jgi:hypothetical protein
MDFWTLQLIAFLIAIPTASFAEWYLHKHFMHRITLISGPFKAHAQVHHRVFRSDRSYLVQPGIRMKDTTFSWWLLPMLLVLASPVILILETLGIHATLGLLAAVGLYYAAFETFHYCMHSPSGLFFENMGFFRFLNKHHLIHHKYMHKNLNVVFPFADKFFDSLLLESPQDLSEGLTAIARETRDSHRRSLQTVTE